MHEQLRKLKEWIWQTDEEIPSVPAMRQEVDSMADHIKQALAHYCEICNQGFRTIGNTTNHKRLKHKISG